MSNGYPRYDIFDPLAEERSRVPLHLRKDTDPVVFWLRQLLDPASRSPVYRAKPLTVLCQEGRPLVAGVYAEGFRRRARLLIVGGLAVEGATKRGLEIAVHYAQPPTNADAPSEAACKAFSVSADSALLTNRREPGQRPIPLRPYDEYGAHDRAELAGVLREAVVGDQSTHDPVVDHLAFRQ
jgi:hypothetical protein